MQRKMLGRPGPTCAIDSLEIPTFFQSGRTRQHEACLIPVLLDFDRVRDAQLVAALRAAAAEDITPIGRAHAFAEPMGLHLMPNIRLVRSFHRPDPLC